MKPNKPYRRRRKLIKPVLQLRLIGTFLGISAVGFLLQALLLTSRLTDFLSSRATDTSLVESIPSLVGGALVVSFLCLLPVTLAVGIVATFKIAGPLYRVEQHLAQVARGEDPGPCRIRRGDHLHGLCDLVNQAIERLRNGAEQAPQESEAMEEERTAA